MKQYYLEPIMSDNQAKNLEGSFCTENNFSLIIRESADVYRFENGKKKLLFCFRKKALPDKLFKNMLLSFKDQAIKTTNSRGKAAGIVDVQQVSPNATGFLSPSNFKSRVIYNDGTLSKYYVSNKVQSMIAGYYDKPKLRDKSDVLKSGRIPCRTTAFTEKFPKQWKLSLPLIESADSLYKKLAPLNHKSQYLLASKTPEYQIEDTAFSTITVNYNWRTAIHIDEGDYHDGLTVVLVAEEGKYAGGYLGYPQYGVAVDIRQGDFMLQDPHQWHCNTEIIGLSKEYTRLSMILYYRENIQKCSASSLSTSEPESKAQIGGNKKIENDKKSKKIEKSVIDRENNNKDHKEIKNETDNPIQLVNVFRKDTNLQLYIRPDTTDSKVIDEVIKRNVYERPSLDFTLEEGDLWLDLGGNIGTFSLLALSKGCSVIVYEPEPENAAILEENLKMNFPNGKDLWLIKKAAITHTNIPGILSLYLSKGSNKYRHTLYPKRGRESINVSTLPFKKEMALYKPTGVKMDIEGAEIDILESVTPADWRKWNTEKLVFEYSFDIDNSIPRFMDIIKTLRKYFSTVHYTKVKENELVYNHFPAATMVYCLK